MRFLLLSALMGIACGALTKPCCMNSKWSGRMTQVGSVKLAASTHGTMVNNVFMMDYDFDMKNIKLVGKTFDPNGNAHDITILEDFTNMKRYTIVGGNCNITHIMNEVITNPCIPQNATNEGSFTFGSGSNAMTVNSFSGLDTNVLYRATVTDDCTLVTLDQFGHTADNSLGWMYAFTFSGIKQGMLSSATPFAVPSMCKTAAQHVG